MTIDPLIPFGPALGYAVNPLDRLSGRRSETDLMDQWRHTAGSVALVLVGDDLLLDAAGQPWFPVDALEALGAPEHLALLGQQNGRAHFALALPPMAEPPAGGLSARNLRGLAMEATLPAADIGAMAQAKALFHWHRYHRFCGHCGAPTNTDQAGWRRVCPVCQTLHFPRTDPVVIMMAVDGERCLLGRQPRFPPGMYSCLAGFVEPGETIEDAVRREIAEESGLRTGKVTYQGSQPWPFPASIMIGCIAEASTTDIQIDRDELEDARWFTRNETRALLDGRHEGGLTCPHPMAIAHHLMRAWASQAG